ncbi:RE1 [Symbiodinium sp. CCMP2592]|nr:RE1 [Symbiodinium sp. CCMP2592]
MTEEELSIQYFDVPAGVRAVKCAGAGEERCVGGHAAQGLLSFGDLVKVLALNPHGYPKLPNLQPVTTAVCHDLACTDGDGEWTVCHGKSLDLRCAALDNASEPCPEELPDLAEAIEALDAATAARSLCAVQRSRDAGTHPEPVDIEVVVDSGSDASCLPMSWGTIGKSGGADSQWYRDAQGNRISGREMRTATIEIAGVKFREHWLLSSVTQPLFCVGKLMKRNGWDIIHDADRVPHLTSPDARVRVPLFYKNYSLHAKGFIRGVTASEAEGQPGIRALEVSGPWLELSEEFHEVSPLVYARRDFSDCFVDCSVALSVPHLSLGVQYRTTLVQDGASWNVIELNQDLSLLEQPEAEFEPKQTRHVITIASCDKIDVDVLFNQRAAGPPEAEQDANMSEAGLPEFPAESLDELLEDAPAGGIGEVDPGEAPIGADGSAAPDNSEPARGHIVVDGVELHEGCNLKTLRAACKALGIGQSGGKATVLSRIASHLDKLKLLERHQVQHDSIALQSEPRQQAPVAAPTPEQIRLHCLNHIPYQPWCEHCIKFQARADKHTQARAETRQCSVCSFDYCFTERPDGERGEKLICLIAKDAHTGACAAIPTPAKGGSVAFRFLVAELCKFISFCGHSEVTLRSDGEPTCRALQQGVKDFRDKLKLVTHLEQVEKDSHEGNPAEQAVEQLRQLTGTLLSQVEHEMGQKISTMSPVHAWAWKHAAWLHTRYARTEAHSPFEIITGRPYLGKLVNFCEVVYARVKSSIKGKARWVKMISLGKLGISDLHFGATQGGFLISSRSVRRLPKQFDPSFLEYVHDMPWTQASFLAGQSGQSRLQKSIAGKSEEAADQAKLPEVVANDGPRPMLRPEPLVPDDTALSAFLPPPPLLISPEPPTPSRVNPALGRAVGPATPADMLPALSPVPQSPAPMLVEDSASAGGDAPVPPAAASSSDGSAMIGGTVRPAPVQAEPPARKRLRLDAVQTDASGNQLFHQDEDVILEDEVAEEYLECTDAADWVEYESEAELEVPSCLIRPFSESEPICSPAELDEIDAVADEFEFQRLSGIGVISEVPNRLEGHRTLTTKSVRTWRPKVYKGSKVWLRRSRLVAREYAHLDPDRPGLFCPTTNQIMLRVIPALFLRRREEGWSMLALDVSDAFLQCSQQHPTVTRIGDKWFKLWRMLPGQRDGSVTWYNDFTNEMKVAVGAELLPESPALFRLPSGAGGGYVHVDDMLAAGQTERLQVLESHLKSKFKVSSEWIEHIGDQVSFLKRRHILVSPTLLVIEPDIKYLDRLMQVTGLANAKERFKAAPFPTGGLPTELASDRELDAATASRYRSGVGILAYMSSDLVACQFAIRYLTTYSHSPTEGSWKLLRHVASYINCHRNHVIGLSKPVSGKGLICDRSREENATVLEVCSDSDWSGCKKTRKSVSSCAILWDNMLLYAHSKTQKTISLSSAEAEYNSLVSAAAEGIFLSACIRFLLPDYTLEQICLVDNSACRALACRQGVGKMRHISGKLLWLQQMTKDNVLSVGPVPTAENVSDLGTKPLKAERIEKLLGMIGIRCADNNYAVVGESYLLSGKDRLHVSRVVKQGGLSAQQIIQVLAMLLQVDRVASSNDEPNTQNAEDALSQDDDNLGVFAQILEWFVYMCYLVHDFALEHPTGIMLIVQLLILIMLCCTLTSRNRVAVLRQQAENDQGSAASSNTPTPSVAVHVKVEGSTVSLASPEPAENPKLSKPTAETATSASSSAAARADDHDAPDPSASSSSAGAMPKATSFPPPRHVIDEWRAEQLVWVTKSRGKSYHHRRTCGTLGNAKALERISRQEAINRGFKKCKCCYGST